MAEAGTPIDHTRATLLPAATHTGLEPGETEVTIASAYRQITNPTPGTGTGPGRGSGPHRRLAGPTPGMGVAL